MPNYQDFDDNLNAFIFELDDVLLPQKDYDLQVYYLFTNFLEYLEPQYTASHLLAFITKQYLQFGNQNMFDALQKTFNLDAKYQQNLDLLFSNAKLPLKLLLFKEALDLLQQIVVNRKQVYILTSGLAQTQLNKIQQTEWNGLDKFLKVYFVDEFAPKPGTQSLTYLINENDLDLKKTVLIGKSSLDKNLAKAAEINYFEIR
ncbi:MAG: hypothetical protein EAZ15_05455 [Sphingobacteriales bacterium]|nr:MAG: hypothetical protein EAZ15_05455 [Sphingobacteriales bacterium]